LQISPPAFPRPTNICQKVRQPILSENPQPWEGPAGGGVGPLPTWAVFFSLPLACTPGLPGPAPPQPHRMIFFCRFQKPSLRQLNRSKRWRTGYRPHSCPLPLAGQNLKGTMLGDREQRSKVPAAIVSGDLVPPIFFFRGSKRTQKTHSTKFPQEPAPTSRGLFLLPKKQSPINLFTWP